MQIKPLELEDDQLRDALFQIRVLDTTMKGMVYVHSKFKVLTQQMAASSRSRCPDKPIARKQLGTS